MKWRDTKYKARACLAVSQGSSPHQLRRGHRSTVENGEKKVTGPSLVSIKENQKGFKKHGPIHEKLYLVVNVLKS
jgi:hypothetical protein